MESMDSFADRMPVVYSLEWNREPHGSISARSLGQAAEAMDTAHGMLLGQFELSRDSGFKGGRSSLADAKPNLEDVNRVAVAERNASSQEHQESLEDDATSLPEPSPSDAENRAPAQRPEDFDMQRRDTSSPIESLHDNDASSTPKPRREGYHVPANTHQRTPARRDTFVPGYAPEEPARQNNGVLGNPVAHTAELQYAGRVITTIRKQDTPEGSNEAREAPSQEGTHDVPGVPSIPNNANALEDSDTTPAWLILINFLLSIVAKSVVLKAIPTLAYTIFAVISIGIPFLRDGFVGAWGWCIQIRLALPQPKCAPINVDEAPGSVGDCDGIAGGMREPKTQTTQCHRCLSEYPQPSIVRCPSGHPICLNCLSVEVTRQASEESPVVVCRQPYMEGEIEVLPDEIIRHLRERARRPQWEERLTIERESLAGIEDETTPGPHIESGIDTISRVGSAISRGTVAVRNHRGARSRVVTEYIVIKEESNEPSPALLVQDQDTDTEYDVDYYTESVSAPRSRDAHTCKGALAGPSNPSGRSDASTPVQRSRFTTAPPPLPQPEREGASTFRSASAAPSRKEEDPLTKWKRLQRNAKARLKTADKAYARSPCQATQEKREIELQACAVAAMEVARLLGR